MNRSWRGLSHCAHTSLLILLLRTPPSRRYTGGTKRRILTGGGTNWLHGHWNGHAGVAYYSSWKTATTDRVSPDTNWLVMCGSNVGASPILANGQSVRSANGGTDTSTLHINGGRYPQETTDFAVAEVIMYAADARAEGSNPPSPLLLSLHWRSRRLSCQLTTAYALDSLS